MPCVIVLGIHRSGTSAVAGVLHTLGVNMGNKLMTPGPSNPRGHFEDMELVSINAMAIGGWSVWADPKMVELSTELRARYALYVAKRSREPLWGIKDPRLCFTLPYILEHLTITTRIISIHRDRDAIAHSLAARGGAPLSLEQAYETHDRYYAEFFKMEVEAEKKKINIPLYYDYLIDEPTHTINMIADMIFGEEFKFSLINLRKIKAAIDFIDPSLRHQKGDVL